MIAPCQPTTETPPRGTMPSARRLVAAVLFERPGAPDHDPPGVAAWRAWLFVGWVVVVAICYGAGLLGMF